MPEPTSARIHQTEIRYGRCHREIQRIAYKPVEINGSKMKEILYGLNEFE
ncbi:MAG: hypothetical protein LBE36_08920 [Flavobacteriaceae bacterium]|jgi:hypothetical protein|nr:hypothetical protein [Flavobacteriaceae bacterium]